MSFGIGDVVATEYGGKYWPAKIIDPSIYEDFLPDKSLKTPVLLHYFGGEEIEWLESNSPLIIPINNVEFECPKEVKLQSSLLCFLEYCEENSIFHKSLENIRKDLSAKKKRKRCHKNENTDKEEKNRTKKKRKTKSGEPRPPKNPKKKPKKKRRKKKKKRSSSSSESAKSGLSRLLINPNESPPPIQRPKKTEKPRKVYPPPPPPRIVTGDAEVKSLAKLKKEEKPVFPPPPPPKITGDTKVKSQATKKRSGTLKLVDSIPIPPLPPTPPNHLVLMNPELDQQHRKTFEERLSFVERNQVLLKVQLNKLLTSQGNSPIVLCGYSNPQYSIKSEEVKSKEKLKYYRLKEEVTIPPFFSKFSKLKDSKKSKIERMEIWVNPNTYLLNKMKGYPTDGFTSLSGRRFIKSLGLGGSPFASNGCFSNSPNDRIIMDLEVLKKYVKKKEVSKGLVFNSPVRFIYEVAVAIFEMGKKKNGKSWMSWEFVKSIESDLLLDSNLKGLVGKNCFKLEELQEPPITSVAKRLGEVGPFKRDAYVE